MIWCNKNKYNFISKLLKTNTPITNTLFLLLANKFFLINNNFDLKKFVKDQTFFDFEFTDDLLANDFMKNKDNVAYAYAIVEAILSKK